MGSSRSSKRRPPYLSLLLQRKDISPRLLGEWIGYGKSQVQRVVAGYTKPSETFMRRTTSALRRRNLTSGLARPASGLARMACKAILWRPLTRDELVEWQGRRRPIVSGREGRAEGSAPGKPIKLALFLKDHPQINRTLLYKIADVSEATFYKALRGACAPTPHTRKALLRALAAMGHQQLSPDLFEPLKGDPPEDLLSPKHNPPISVPEVMGPPLEMVHEQASLLAGRSFARRKPRKMIPQRMLDHWGLARNPFADPESADELFLTEDLQANYEVLKEAASKQGFAALVGRIGSGKTTMINYLLHLLKNGSDTAGKYQICHLRCIQKEQVRGRHLLEALIEDLPGQERPKQTMEAMSRQVMKLVQNVRTNHRRNPVLIVEEAQGLSNDGFRALKRLRELAEEGFRKNLAIILVGQTESHPDLVTRLESVHLSEVHARCHIIRMEGLREFEHVREYVNKRLRKAGTRRTTLVDDSAVQVLLEHHGGTVFPQAVNRILTDALIEGFKKKSVCIDGELIQRVL